jgi:hypothetical protein
MGPNDHLAAVPFEYKGSAEASADISFSPIPSIPVHTPGPALVNYATDDKGATSSKAPIYTVEMAELQIFTGVTLDTGVEANRRTFIDFERDADGNPIRNDDGKRTLKPVNPKQAEDLLGKRPDILLHGTTKWQAGKNTGSLGIDADGEEIPSGQFTPTGEIKKYSPDPSIVEA